jgi:hypothetical protein
MEEGYNPGGLRRKMRIPNPIYNADHPQTKNPGIRQKRWCAPYSQNPGDLRWRKVFVLGWRLSHQHNLRSPGFVF